MIDPNPATPSENYVVPHATLTKLGHGCPMAGRRVLRAMIDLEVEHEPINGPTEKPASVRAAVEADEGSILELLRLGILGNGDHIAPFDPKATLDVIQNATRKNLYSIGVIGDSNHIEGAICLVPATWFWANEGFLVERFAFVRPEHRDFRHISALWNYAKWLTDQLNKAYGRRTFLIGGITASIDPWPKAALYRRLLNFTGGIYSYPTMARPS